MDYSLMLIVIHFPKQEDAEYQNIINIFGEQRYRSRIFKSKKEKYIYCLGIIDYLQKFDLSKFLENKYKSELKILNKYLKFKQSIQNCLQFITFV